MIRDFREAIGLVVATFAVVAVVCLAAPDPEGAQAVPVREKECPEPYLVERVLYTDGKVCMLVHMTDGTSVRFCERPSQS